MTWGQSKALLCSTILMAGCATTLHVETDAGKALSGGIPQVLPFTQYDVTASWRVVSCSNEPPTDPAFPPETKVALAVTATARSEDDPEQRYLIDPRSLQSPVTRSEFNVTYHEGSNTLRTVNAEVEDRTAAVIGNLVTTAVNIAPLLTGGARQEVLSLSSPEKQQPSPPCTIETLTALQRVRTLKTGLEDDTRALNGARDDLATLAATVAAMGEAVDAATIAEYRDALKTVRRLITSQAEKTRELETALRAITHQTTTRWPMSGGELERAQPLTLPPEVSNQWIGSSSYPDWPTAHLAIVRATPLIRRTSTAGVPADYGGPQRTPANHQVVSGIPYNTVVRGRLITCSRRCADEPDDAEHRRTVVEGLIPQLGNVYVLTVRNPPLGSTAFSAEFARDATLLSTGYEQRSAPLETGTAALADATGRLAPLLDPTQRLARETAYLEALRDRRDAAAALEPAAASPTADARAALEAETALLNAEIANRQARLTLDALTAAGADD